MNKNFVTIWVDGEDEPLADGAVDIKAMPVGAVRSETSKIINEILLDINHVHGKYATISIKFQFSEILFEQKVMLHGNMDKSLEEATRIVIEFVDKLNNFLGLLERVS